MFTLTLLAWVVPALGAPGGLDHEVILRDMTGADCIREVFAISEDVASKLPQWLPSKELPPLSIAKAIAVATEWATKQHPKFDSVELRSIELGKVGWGRYPDRWYYLLQFEPVIEKRRFFGGEVTVALTMDGTVVAPRSETVKSAAMPCQQ
jgi:hypothetical protein